MKKTHSITAWAALIMLFGCGGQKLVLPENNETSTLSGIVYPAHISARVFLEDNGIAVDSAVSDPQTGVWSMEEVPYGYYTLRVRAAGYGEEVRTLSVETRWKILGSTNLHDYPGQVSMTFPTDSVLIDSVYMSDYSSYFDNGVMTAIIAFEEKMDEASILDAIVIPSWINAGGVEPLFSSGGDRLTLDVPLHLLLGRTKVKISLGSKAKTAEGTFLEFDLNRTFFLDSAYIRRHFFRSFITETDPADKETYVNPVTSISIRFGRKMSRASVEKAFSITPETPVNLFWSGYYGYDELSVRFPGALLPSTVYTFSVERGAMSSDSVTLDTRIDRTFTTRPLEVNGFSPLNGAASVSTNAVFTYRFNLRLTPAVFEKAFSIQPAVPGLHFGYNSDSSEVEVSHTGLEPATEYVIKVDSSLFGGEGMEYGKTIIQVFTTEPVRAPPYEDGFIIPYATPSDTGSPISVSKPLTFTFPALMDAASVENRLSLEPFTLFHPDWDAGPAGAHLLRIVPIHPLRSATVYSITLDSGYRTSEGAPGGRFLSTFKTNAMALVDFFPYHGAVGVGRDRVLEYAFNTDADTSAFLNHIAFVPAVDSPAIASYSAYTTTGGTYYRISISHGPLAPGTEYTVTLQESISDVYGIPMGVRYYLSFTTGN